jgi:hypothetical protein
MILSQKTEEDVIDRWDYMESKLRLCRACWKDYSNHTAARRGLVEDGVVAGIASIEPG